MDGEMASLVGDVIVEARQQNPSLTLSFIASACNVTRQTVANWMDGAEIPRPDRIPALATVLSTSELDLHLARLEDLRARELRQSADRLQEIDRDIDRIRRLLGPS